MSILTIEAALAPDLKADVDFTIFLDAPGIDPEVTIERVTPFGIVPAITENDLWNLAAAWLDNGGYDACCRLAEVKNCGARQ